MSDTDRIPVPTMETSAATIRFNNSSASDSSESDCDDDALSTNKSRLAKCNDTVNVDPAMTEGHSDVDIVNGGTPTKCKQPEVDTGSSALLRGKTRPIDHESVNCIAADETPLDTSPSASSNPRTCVTSEQGTEQDSKIQTSSVAPTPISPLGNHPGGVQGNRHSLRFDPFNTLCHGDDEIGDDLSHRFTSNQAGQIQREQGWSQVDGTADHNAGISPPFTTRTGQTDGLPTLVTTGVMKQPSTNCTTSSESWTDPFDSISMDQNSEVNTELNVAEEHFSQPEAHFRMSNREELEAAIKTCKLQIVDVEPNSEDAKNVIHKLVQLRLKLADSMEEKDAEDKNIKIVVGHHFEEKQSRSSKHYCEKCNSVIWGMLQRWYRCTACSFCTHAKCLNLITRKCAAVKVSENPCYLMTICCERGLSSQNYSCADCRAKIGFQRGFPEARQCDYNGDFFCDMCHWNDTAVIPARVLHNWDFEPRKVCRASKQFLRLIYSRPVLHIQQINPMLFSYVEELNDTKRLREEIIIMKRYFLSCKAALSSKLLLQLRPRQHFVETSDMYSLKDLVDVATDVLLPELAKIHASIAQHIKTDCQVCQSKGYICELCDLREVLFPFDSIAIVCPQCAAVLHRHCYMQSGRHCPNCERRSRDTS